MINRHDKAILFFSGGKDSLATLHLLRPYWSKILVVWINAGAPLPETVEQMRHVSEEVPHFMQVNARQSLDIEQHGMPVDLLPAAYSALRAETEGEPPFLLRPWQACCWNNLWAPTHQLMQQLRSEGYTLIIRGQKLTDPKKATTRNGDQLDGFEFWFPIEDWTDADVFRYLAEQHVEVPAHYAYFGSSLDCWSCTAHVAENVGKLAYLDAHHPEKGAELRRRMVQIREVVNHEVNALNQFIG